MTPSLRDQLSALLGHTYRIERELGGGGMARVFLADEIALGRSVVLKVLAPDVAGTIDADRFRREITFAATLNHPHLVPLLTAGEVNGVPYYTMPFVRGRTLRDRLLQGGALPLAEAVSIFRDVLTAVAYAHRNGVAHRDLKPENILLSEGGAIVADLGIAKAIGASTGGGARDATSAGVVLGTPAYMAPEQATADPAADQRVDIYAVGAVMFEMLAGRPPFNEGTSTEIMRAHVHQPTPDVRTARSDLPEPLAALVTECLAKRPSDRPQMADDVLKRLDAIGAAPTAQHMVWTAGGSAIVGGANANATTASAASSSPPRWWRRLAAALALLGVAGAIGWAMLPAASRAVVLGILWRSGPVVTDGRVVIVPFVNQTGDTSLTVFGDMAADWLTRGISRTGTVEVVDARTAKIASLIVDSTGVVRFRGRDIEIAGETGAALVISGNYYRDRDTLHIEARLLDVRKQRTVPLASLSGSVTRQAPLVEELRKRVMGTLAPIVNGDRAWSDGMGDPPSYEAFLEVYNAVASFARGDTADAFRRYRRAEALDSAYVVPLILNAYAHADVGIMERNSAALDTARALLERAEQRRANAIPSELVMMDYIRAQATGDAERTYAAARDGIRLLPGSDIAVIAAMSAVWAGRPDSALSFIARSDALRGVNLIRPGYWRWKISALQIAARWDEAIEAAEQALRQFPDDAELHAMHAIAFAGAGQTGEARAAGERLLQRASVRREPRLVHAAASVAQALAAGGDTLAARAFARDAIARVPAAASDTSVAGRRAWGRLALAAGHDADAAAAYRAVLERRPSDAAAEGALALLAARRGAGAESRALLARTLPPNADGLSRADALVWRARAYAQLGDEPAALQALAEAIATGATFGNPLEAGLPNIATAPEFATLAANPVFTALTRPRR
ncbi:MAG: serine/threonine-protein kinase [Gemmatimonadaceae bacterium]|nr:serine/threonine-protein kinase [Gemmatimonadaceae bacterium]